MYTYHLAWGNEASLLVPETLYSLISALRHAAGKFEQIVMLRYKICTVGLKILWREVEILMILYFLI